MKEANETHKLVQQAYGAVARQQSSCCGPTPASASQAPAGQSCCCGPVAAHPLPEADLGLSCGDPLSFALIQEGQTVLDLGSGAGRDAFLAARAVGPSGWVIGVDMTPEMIALARENAAKLAGKTGLVNVEFRQGYIEALPVESDTVDLVISNCVINLSPDKPQVFREAYRVLKPGGHLVVSDIVLRRELPPAAREHAGLYAACVAGALLREDYLKAIQAAGFAEVRVATERQYQASDPQGDPLTVELAEELTGAAESITVVAKK